MANVKYHSAKVWAIAHPEIAVKIWNIWLEFISDFFYFLEALLSVVSWKLKLILPCEIEKGMWQVIRSVLKYFWNLKNEDVRKLNEELFSDGGTLWKKQFIKNTKFGLTTYHSFTTTCTVIKILFLFSNVGILGWSSKIFKKPANKGSKLHTELKSFPKRFTCLKIWLCHCTEWAKFSWDDADHTNKPTFYGVMTILIYMLLFYLVMLNH